MKVKELIEKLEKFDMEMEVSIDYAGGDIEDVKILTWVDGNYPYNREDKDYVVIM